MRAPKMAVAAWLTLLLAGALVVARAHYTADLSAFLPHSPSAAQRLLIDQLRDGPASRLILVAIEGDGSESRARLSKALASQLQADPQFQYVANGDHSDIEADRKFVFDHRYLLSDQVTTARFSAPGLHAAIADNIDMLASSIGTLAGGLFTRDPTGETLQVIAQWEDAARPSLRAGVWAAADGHSALLAAQTRAAGSDTTGQMRALATIRNAFATAQRAVPEMPLASARLLMTGPGVFAVTAHDTIKREAVRFSVLSSVLIAAFLLAVYRSVWVLVLGLLPVASGALAGVAAVAVGFGVVHAVTIGFGATLIGESVDYSIYLFMQTQGGDPGDRHARESALWPTIWLGMLTSVCGFASLLPSEFPGLAQLGLYSIAGLVAAALVTRYILPVLMPRSLHLHTAAPLGSVFSAALAVLCPWRAWLWPLACVAAIVLVTGRNTLWNHDLSALSPVSAADQSLDARLRASLGAPDVRSLVVVSGSTLETTLQTAERVSSRLDVLVAVGELAHFQSPTRYLPSERTQTARRASLPSAEDLAARLVLGLKELPIHPTSLSTFQQDVETARNAPLLTRTDLAGTSMAAAFDALVTHREGRWNVLVPLQSVNSGPHAFTIDDERVNHELLGTAQRGTTVTVLDLKRESDSLYSNYLSAALSLSLLGFGAIVLLLWVFLGSVTRVARVIAPLLLAVLMVMAGFSLRGQRLTLLHLIGLLLIVAIGSNYALFFDRRMHAADSAAQARTLASLLVANLTTVIAFGTLSLSTVPVLYALGTTVAPGALLALLFAAVMARPHA